MNILPHKSWHVRTKKNIARVRKDEAQAAEEEKERQRKISLAAQESRTAQLRQRASERLASSATSAEIDVNVEVAIPLPLVNDIVQQDGHVNFFQDVEDGKRQGGVNEDAEAEKKKEQEDYEKKIGYLVYLGQDSLEASKQKPWYANIDRQAVKSTAEEEFDKIKTFETSGYMEGHTKECKLTAGELKVAKLKTFQDPLQDMRKYLKTPGMVQKYDKSKSSEISEVTKASGSGRIKRPASEDACSSSSSSKKLKKLKKEKSKKSSKKHKSKDKKKHKRRKHSTPEESSGSEENSEDEQKRLTLEKLRTERLEREREERRKTEQLLAKLRGEKLPEIDDGKQEGERNLRNNSTKRDSNENSSHSRNSNVKQKYNSQFNPELARQNYDFR